MVVRALNWSVYKPLIYSLYFWSELVNNYCFFNAQLTLHPHFSQQQVIVVYFIILAM